MLRKSGLKLRVAVVLPMRSGVPSLTSAANSPDFLEWARTIFSLNLNSEFLKNLDFQRQIFKKFSSSCQISLLVKTVAHRQLSSMSSASNSMRHPGLPRLICARLWMNSTVWAQKTIFRAKNIRLWLFWYFCILFSKNVTKTVTRRIPRTCRDRSLTSSGGSLRPLVKDSSVMKCTTQIVVGWGFVYTIWSISWWIIRHHDYTAW